MQDLLLMHVAYIHQHFSTKQGTTGTRSYEMAQRLLAAGHRVTMICGINDHTAHVFGDGERIREMDIDGIRVVCIAEPYSNVMSFGRRLLSFGRFARAAAKAISRLDADLVFATSTPLTVGIPGMKGARKLGVPFVFEVRDLWPELPIAMNIVRNPALKWYLQRMERRIYFAAAHVIALAPGIEEGICRTGYPPDRISMIPNSCDVELFRPDDTPLDDLRFGPPGEFRLVFTGAHGLANGLDAVLDAAAELKRRNASGIRFVFIGRGSQRERLMARSQREGLGGMITWMESIPKHELATVLPRMDVGLMILKNVPAFYYGTSPNKFFDYIASGLPVLNNYPGWLADMIEENGCGIVIPPEDPHAFADRVLWMRDHPQQLQDLGKRARKLAESRFSRDRLGAEFVRILESVQTEHARR